MIDPSNYTFGLPVAASTYASRVDLSLHILHIAMAAIFVLWSVFFFYCLFRFRRRAGVPAAYHSRVNSTVSYVPDAAVLVFELWLIFMLGLPIWAQIKEEFPPDDKSLVVEMMAEQFAWSFQYPGADNQFGRKDPKQISSSNTLGLDGTDPVSQDDVISINELHVPLGKPTIVYMTSKDVIHSLFVPEFRVKQDAVPGMRIPLWFEPTKTGRYEIGCAQLCGLGHYRMKGEVVVHTPEEFTAWQAERAKELQEARNEI